MLIDSSECDIRADWLLLKWCSIQVCWMKVNIVVFWFFEHIFL